MMPMISGSFRPWSASSPNKAAVRSSELHCKMWPSCRPTRHSRTRTRRGPLRRAKHVLVRSHRALISSAGNVMTRVIALCKWMDNGGDHMTPAQWLSYQMRKCKDLSGRSWVLRTARSAPRSGRHRSGDRVAPVQANAKCLWIVVDTPSWFSRTTSGLRTSIGAWCGGAGRFAAAVAPPVAPSSCPSEVELMSIKSRSDSSSINRAIIPR